MKKMLFTDGWNSVTEVQSPEELEELIEQAADTRRVRIWLFSTNEWISYEAYRKMFPQPVRKQKSGMQPLAVTAVPPATAPKKSRFRKLVYFTGAVAGVLLVLNFTRIKWSPAGTLRTNAARPANMPVMDIDSLIDEIEYSRGLPVDRNTRTNLRLRNTWPDRILLQATAGRETNGNGSRFSGVELRIDNTTGFPLDQAVVRLSVWKNKKVTGSDTLQFGNIRFDKLAIRQLDKLYRGDSISVAFESIRAKAFNFCYNAATKNNSGNYNDRWFCRE